MSEQLSGHALLALLRPVAEQVIGYMNDADVENTRSCQIYWYTNYGTDKDNRKALLSLINYGVISRVCAYCERRLHAAYAKHVAFQRDSERDADWE